MKKDYSLDPHVLRAIREGHDTREALMAIDNLRLQTWADVSESLQRLVKHGALIQTKKGWRLPT